MVFLKISSPLERVSTSPGEKRAWPNLKSCLNPSFVRISSGYVREPICWESDVGVKRQPIVAAVVSVVPPGWREVLMIIITGRESALRPDSSPPLPRN